MLYESVMESCRLIRQSVSLDADGNRVIVKEQPVDIMAAFSEDGTRTAETAGGVCEVISYTVTLLEEYGAAPGNIILRENNQELRLTGAAERPPSFSGISFRQYKGEAWEYEHGTVNV